jgi:hypothetical protein
MVKFLEKLRECGNVRLSCEAAGLPRRTVYNWREKWSTFRDGWDIALEDACDTLEAEAWERAKESSDRLLMFLLKAHRPDKYKDRAAIEHSGEGGGPLVISYVNDWRGAQGAD